MKSEVIGFLVLLSLGSVSAQAAQSVSESEPFLLNLDGRPSIVDTAPLEYVLWLTEYFTVEDLFDLSLVSEESDADSDGRSNLFEYRAALDPASGVQDFQIIVLGGESSEVEISPINEDVRFEVERSFDLINWATVGSTSIERSGLVARVGLESQAVPAYFRIRLLERELSL